MATTDRTESAKWTQATDEMVDKLENGVRQALDKNASKGFPAPTGATLESILGAGQEVKGKLTEANAKIYDDRRQTIFQIQEFNMKILVRIAKLALEVYQAELLNALALEQSEAEGVRQLDLADVERTNVEIETRQVAIMQARAEMEHNIIGYRQQLVAAETESLGSEEILIQAQLETAEKKLEIIDSIYQVLAAEELVLAAERRRAVSLELVLEAQQILADIKREMVPFYLDKAKARGELAVAVGLDAKIREEIERLGYDRIALKEAEEGADHLVREANVNFELAHQTRIRSDQALEIARFQSRRILQEYANDVRTSILAKKKLLEEDGIDFKLRIALARQGLGMENEATIVERERSNLNMELAHLLTNMVAQAMDQASTVRASAEEAWLGIQNNIKTFRQITKG